MTSNPPISDLDSRRKTLWIVVAVLPVAAGLVWGAIRAIGMSRLSGIRERAHHLEEEGAWPDLLIVAREWHALAPADRDAMLAGVLAARRLRDPRAAAEFLAHFPQENPDDVEWLSMLADLQFGPLTQPVPGARTCRAILRLDPKHERSHQRLIYFHAMLQEHAALLTAAHNAAKNGVDNPEFHIYAFLADAPRLSNGIAQTEQWIQGSSTEPTLLVAHALHIAQSLEGAIPSMDESQADAMRVARQKRDDQLKLVRERFPRNLTMTAYFMNQAMEQGHAAEVGELLNTAPSEADDDDRFWRARGWLFLRLGEHAEAESALLKAVALNPLSWRTRYSLSDLRRRQSRMDEAEHLHRLAGFGRRLERDVLSHRNVRSIPQELIVQLAEFAELCGDVPTTESLRRHLAVSEEAKPVQSIDVTPGGPESPSAASHRAGLDISRSSRRPGT